MVGYWWMPGYLPRTLLAMLGVKPRVIHPLDGHAKRETWKVIYLSYQGSVWQPPFPDCWNSSCNNLPHKTHLSRLDWTLSQDGEGW